MNTLQTLLLICYPVLGLIWFCLILDNILNTTVFDELFSRGRRIGFAGVFLALAICVFIWPISVVCHIRYGNLRKLLS